MSRTIKVVRATSNRRHMFQFSSVHWQPKKTKQNQRKTMSVSFQVAAKALETAVFGAYYNVIINLKDITDDAFKEAVSTVLW